MILVYRYMLYRTREMEDEVVRRRTETKVMICGFDLCN